jgi:hypothetical protein
MHVVHICCFDTPRCYYADGQPKTPENLLVLEGRHRLLALQPLLRTAAEQDKRRYATVQVQVLQNLAASELPLIAQRKCRPTPVLYRPLS